MDLPDPTQALNALYAALAVAAVRYLRNKDEKRRAPGRQALEAQLTRVSAQLDAAATKADVTRVEERLASIEALWHQSDRAQVGLARDIAHLQQGLQRLEVHVRQVDAAVGAVREEARDEVRQLTQRVDLAVSPHGRHT